LPTRRVGAKWLLSALLCVGGKTEDKQPTKHSGKVDRQAKAAAKPKAKGKGRQTSLPNLLKTLSK